MLYILFTTNISTCQSHSRTNRVHCHHIVDTFMSFRLIRTLSRASAFAAFLTQPYCCFVPPTVSVPFFVVSPTAFPAATYPSAKVPVPLPSHNRNLPFVVSPNPFVTPVTASPSPLPAPATTLPVVLVMPETPWPTVLPAAPRVLPIPDAAVPKKPVFDN
jgi:hypothetical protein